MKRLSCWVIGMLALITGCTSTQNLVQPKRIQDAVLATGGSDGFNLEQKLQEIAQVYGVSYQEAEAEFFPRNELSPAQDALGKVDLGDYVRTHNDDENKTFFARYGVQYRVEGANSSILNTLSNSPFDLTSCPKFFAPEKAAIVRIGSQLIAIDRKGRPYEAWLDLPVGPTRYQRDETCQRNVGAWGRDEDSANLYDGGHLIGYQLGGWNKRANLVPQERTFNQVFWRTTEGRVARCNIKGLYRVWVIYPDDANSAGPGRIIPQRMSSWVQRPQDRSIRDIKASISYPNSPQASITAYFGDQTTFFASLISIGCI